jgi:hypothetical protein
MAELVIPDEYVNIHFLFTLTGDAEPMSFAIGAKFAGLATYQDVSDDAYVAFSGGYGAGNYYSQWTFLGTRVEIAAGAVAETLIPLPGTGGTLGTLVQNTTCLVKKLTGEAGRKFRGRCYVPPISLAEVDVSNTGMIDPTTLSTIQTNWDSFTGALSASTSIEELYLFHTDPTDPTQITDFQVEAQVATQRRRLR